jgi:Fe-S cluster assembly ATP-binding protein
MPKSIPLLEVSGLHVRREGTEILRGIDLKVDRGEVHTIMGPNGSGKSTLANSLVGNPSCEVTAGAITFDGKDMIDEDADIRARAGMFMAFQYPVEIPGVPLSMFLREALNSRRPEGEGIGAREFRKVIVEQMETLQMDPSFVSRYLNDGFSGGEKKRCEILQMAILKPSLAVMDETDSGLDIDALRIVSDGVNKLRGPDLGVLLITHYQRILNYIKPDFIHVLVDGRIVDSGGPELAIELEEAGYDRYTPSAEKV